MSAVGVKYISPKKCELCGFEIEDPDDVEWHGIGNCVDLCPECGADEEVQCRTCNGSGWIATAE